MHERAEIKIKMNVACSNCCSNLDGLISFSGRGFQGKLIKLHASKNWWNYCIHWIYESLEAYRYKGFRSCFNFLFSRLKFDAWNTFRKNSSKFLVIAGSLTENPKSLRRALHGTGIFRKILTFCTNHLSEAIMLPPLNLPIQTQIRHDKYPFESLPCLDSASPEVKIGNRFSATTVIPDRGSVTRARTRHGCGFGLCHKLWSR